MPQFFGLGDVEVVGEGDRTENTNVVLFPQFGYWAGRGEKGFFGIQYVIQRGFSENISVFSASSNKAVPMVPGQIVIQKKTKKFLTQGLVICSVRRAVDDCFVLIQVGEVKIAQEDD